MDRLPRWLRQRDAHVEDQLLVHGLERARQAAATTAEEFCNTIPHYPDLDEAYGHVAEGPEAEQGRRESV